MIKETNKRRKR